MCNMEDWTWAKAFTSDLGFVSWRSGEQASDPLPEKTQKVNAEPGQASAFFDSNIRTLPATPQ